MISQSVALVHPVPLAGIKMKNCLYRVSILESRNKITATIGADTFNAIGKSTAEGLEGVKAALINAVVIGKPTVKNDEFYFRESAMMPEEVIFY